MPTFQPNTTGGWRLLRTMDGTADPDWLGELEDPDTAILLVGGTASDGNYDIDLVVSDSQGNAIETLQARFERAAAETNAEIATALLADAVTEFATYLIDTADDASAEIRLTFDPAYNYTLSLTAPGSGSITPDPGLMFPITAGMSHGAMRGEGVPTRLSVVAIGIDDGALLGHEGTVDMQLVEMLPRVDRTGEIPIGRTTTADTPLGEVATFTMSGAKRWTIRVTDPTNLNAGLTDVEIWYRIERT